MKWQKTVDCAPLKGKVLLVLSLLVRTRSRPVLRVLWDDDDFFQTLRVDIIRRLKLGSWTSTKLRLLYV
jgi:hypothetical protein